MPAGHLRRGARGEDAACEHLRARGFRIIDRNWRGRRGELDIVARQGETLVFVEVKTRDEQGLAAPVDALTREKRARLARAAQEYLSATNGWSQPCRFDLVAVTVGGDGRGQDIEHIENAFVLEGGGGWQPW